MTLKALSLMTAAALAAGPAETACAQERSSADSTINAALLKTLKLRRADLKKEIEEADRKRKRAIDGVSAESLERMNLAQDSICLELRSELVRVDLEIRELTPDATPAQLMQYYNRLHAPASPATGAPAPQRQPAKKR